jgi:hypothetical protein
MIRDDDVDDNDADGYDGSINIPATIWAVPHAADSIAGSGP